MKTRLLLLVTLISNLIFAQSGSLDLTFNPTDLESLSGTASNGNIYGSTLQPDGKILIYGTFTSYNGNTINNIARLNSNGTFDTTFNTGSGANNSVERAVVQSDGKIIIVGTFQIFNGSTRNRIARLNSDGSLDTTFNPNLGADQIISNVVIQNDNKILIVGLFSTYNGTPAGRIARLNTDGTIDASFNVGTGFTQNPRKILLQPDGKIIIAGFFTSFNGIATVPHIIRLNTDGTKDSSFTTGTFNNGMFDCAFQNDGKIIIAGDFTTYNVDTSYNRIARLNSDGTLDTTFNPGSGAGNSIRTVAIQNDGKILIGGLFGAYNGTVINRIARINENGTLDATFTVGTGFNSDVNSLFIQPDGKIKVGGFFTSYNGLVRNRVTRINQNGLIDLSFNPAMGANLTVHCSAKQADGKIVIGGDFLTYNGESITRLTRLNADGSRDTSFNTTTINGSVRAIAIQADGKIIIGGNFTGRILRLNADGSTDASFTIGANNWVVAIAIQNDGKIIIGGDFTLYNGVARNRIARLNSDGTLDTSFTVGTGANSTVRAIAIQPDGKIIVGGNFTTYAGATANRIVRVNTNGSYDSTYLYNAGFNSAIFDIEMEADGRHTVVGDFTIYNGNAINRIARFNANGVIDGTVNPVLGGANAIIYSITKTADNKYLIGGDFTNYNGVPINRIAKLNANLTIDSSFNPGTAANTAINTISIQTDDKIIIGGDFTSYNGTVRTRLARLENSTLSSSGFNLNEKTIVVYPNPFSNQITFDLGSTSERGTISIYDISGKQLYQTKFDGNSATINNLGSLPAGIYLATLTTENGTSITKKIVK